MTAVVETHEEVPDHVLHSMVLPAPIVAVLSMIVLRLSMIVLGMSRVVLGLTRIERGLSRVVLRPPIIILGLFMIVLGLSTIIPTFVVSSMLDVVLATSMSIGTINWSTMRGSNMRNLRGWSLEVVPYRFIKRDGDVFKYISDTIDNVVG